MYYEKKPVHYVLLFSSAVVCNMFYKLEKLKKEKHPTHVLFTCVFKFSVHKL